MSHRPSSSTSTSTAPASGVSSSTRDQILQRYAKTTSGGAATGSDHTRQAMELFETEDAQQLDSSPPARSVLHPSVSSKKVGGVGAEDVDTSRLRPSLAFQKFAGALYIGGGGEGAGRGAVSYEAGPSHLAVPSGSNNAVLSESQALRLKFESPFVKLGRLQEELKEFEVELREAQMSMGGGGRGGSEGDNKEEKEGGDLWSSLSNAVHQLQGQLSSMLAQPHVRKLLEDKSQEEAAAAMASSSLLPQFDTLFEQYVAEISANPSFQPFPTDAAADSSAAATTSSSADLAVLPKLDERLNSLEKLLGTSSSVKKTTAPMLSFNAGSSSSASGAAAPAVLPAPDLVTALSSLHAQLQQLTPQRLEMVARSCKQILIEQESIALQNKQKEEEANKTENGAADSSASRPFASQVSHLYSLTSRWDSLALTLPTLISRLSSLHTLHASSATVVNRVAQLERQSAAIDAALKAQKQGMDSVTKAAADNLRAIQDNFASMDKKIQELNAKMEKLASM